ncbi:hypothetical protein V2H45_10625 [Tumidithrix elongata RA019]|uniref:Uncharacterized protein n=1 Tax=Tumidithrix elongata BACA0141 TaxID=2716417 RepID=A0AAW9Q3J8_9CYAN|nr:hypothetical protein [Tumidithrix elongata RA019]
MKPNNSSGKSSERDDDRALVNFLQQYKPAAPAPVSNLEQEIMHKIVAEPQTQRIHNRTKSSVYKNLLWGLPLAIAAMAAGIWFGSRPSEPQLSQADRDTIEASLVHSWSTATDQETEDTATAYLLLDPSTESFTSYQ